MYQSNYQDFFSVVSSNMFKHFHFFLQQHPSTTLFAMHFTWRSKQRLMLKPWCKSHEGALTLSLHQWAQNSSRPSFNYCSPPSELSMSDCFCHKEDKRSLQPWFVSSNCWCPEEKGYLWVCECVYGVHGGCMWGYVAGVTFLHQLLLISPHSRNLKFRSRRDVVGFRGWSEGVFLCVSLTRDRYSKYTYYLHHKLNSRPLGWIQPASIHLLKKLIFLYLHSNYASNPLWSVLPQIKLH